MGAKGNKNGGCLSTRLVSSRDLSGYSAAFFRRLAIAFLRIESSLALISGDISRFWRYGFRPKRNGWRAQSVDGQSLTSFALLQQQSRHLALIALIGFWYLLFRDIFLFLAWDE